LRTTKLASANIEVSALCLGAMFMGSKNDVVSSYQLLDEYMALGGTFIDTANTYAYWIPGFLGGESETVLGSWMKERKNRSRIFLASKVGFDYPGAQRGLSAHLIEEECNKSLRRLQTDVIDLHYAHIDDIDTPLEETLEAFYRLHKAGKVRYIGASNYLAWRLEEARCISVTHNWLQFCCVQQRFTYLQPKQKRETGRRADVNHDLIDYARLRQFPIMAYGVLLGGAYSRSDRAIGQEYAGPDSDARLAMLKTIAAETNATVNQVIIAWMLHNDYPVVPLIAASTREQLRENLQALDVKLSSEQMNRLETISAIL